VPRKTSRNEVEASEREKDLQGEFALVKDVDVGLFRRVNAELNDLRQGARHTVAKVNR
jgi:hypothetical protein